MENITMPDIFIPTLHTFAMKNTFTGSCGMLRFKIVPEVYMMENNPKEVDFSASSIHAEYWHGLLCYEKSTVEGKRTFPLTEAGRMEMKAWLESKIS